MTCDSPIIRVNQLEVTYGEQVALRDLTLEIPQRQITALVGPSGCGKSTFLNTLNRLTDLLPDCKVSGSIQLNDVDILSAECDLYEIRRRVGMVFQKAVPFPLSIEKNLTLPLSEHGLPRSEQQKLAQQALKDVGLWDEVKDRLKKPAMNLSGGQQQRLCIARALALNPEVLLLDEPCSALDPIASRVVENLIVSLRKRMTIVIVTHNLAQAKRIANHMAIFWIRNGAGTVIEQGPAAALFLNPREAVAQEYLSGTCG